MPSVRTQIYLTSEQRRRLNQLARRKSVPVTQLVKEAMDSYLDESVPDPETALSATFGSIPNLEVPSRDEWNRG